MVNWGDNWVNCVVNLLDGVQWGVMAVANNLVVHNWDSCVFLVVWVGESRCGQQKAEEDHRLHDFGMLMKVRCMERSLVMR